VRLQKLEVKIKESYKIRVRTTCSEMKFLRNPLRQEGFIFAIDGL
jgi:hypothetical protein